MPSGRLAVLPEAACAVDTLVVGDGVAGLVTAALLHDAGRTVTIVGDSAGCSPHAGGMLAPISELDVADPDLSRLGLDAPARWRALVGDHAHVTGTLHLAHRPEWPLLDELVRRVEAAGHHVERLGGAGIAAHAPALARRFERGLFAAGEGHVDPAVVLPALRERLDAAGVTRVDGRVELDGGTVHTAHGPRRFPTVVDARGLTATGTRGVRGEYVVVRTASVSLPGPIRVTHPRFPLYVVPRGQGRFYVGATQIESESTEPPHVRSLLELLSALYSLHPGFGDAVVEHTGAALRPALPHNRPEIRFDGTVLTLNGLFRHGYLLAPALGAAATALLSGQPVHAEARPFVEEVPCAS
jgi:glycine oxidase